MFERAPGDHGDHLIVAEIRDAARCDMAAVAQHRHRIAKGAHFAQPMRDEQSRHAFGALVGDDPAQPVDVAAG
jgi:hypothetical protein